MHGGHDFQAVHLAEDNRQHVGFVVVGVQNVGVKPLYLFAQPPSGSPLDTVAFRYVGQSDTHLSGSLRHIVVWISDRTDVREPELVFAFEKARAVEDRLFRPTAAPRHGSQVEHSSWM